MVLSSLFQLFGLSGFFSSRAFLPAFLAAFCLRFGYTIPYLNQLEIFKNPAAVPTWFTNDITLLVLGLLALMESYADKVPEFEEIMSFVNRHLKTGLSILTLTGIIHTSDVNFINKAVTPAAQAGVGDWGIVLVAGAITYTLAGLREGLFTLFRQADPDDQLKIRKTLSWFEDLWIGGGIFMLVLFPVIFGAICGLIWLCVYLYLKRAHRVDASYRYNCGNCSEEIRATASRCRNCSTKNPAPLKLDWLGFAKNEVNESPDSQPYLLAGKFRCPVCAERKKGNGFEKACDQCGFIPAAEPGFLLNYLAAQDGKLVKVLLFTAVAGLVPVAGMIIGLIYGRVVMHAPLQNHLSKGERFMWRWVVRMGLIFALPFMVQPVTGWIALPAFIAVVYYVYRSLFAARYSRSMALRLEAV